MLPPLELLHELKPSMVIASAAAVVMMVIGARDAYLNSFSGISLLLVGLCMWLN